VSEEEFPALVREHVEGLRLHAVELARALRDTFRVRGEPWRGEAAYHADPHKAVRNVVTACRRLAAALGPLRAAVPAGEREPGTVAHAVLEVERAYQMILGRYGWTKGLPCGRVRIGWIDDVPPEIPEHHVRLAGSIEYLEQALGRLEPNPSLTSFIAEGATAADPWDGEDWDALAPLVRRLLRYMHGRERADLADLCPIVWERDYSAVSEPALYSAMNKANAFLAQRERRTLEKVRRESIVRWA
jgi:hypothetical protein